MRSSRRSARKRESSRFRAGRDAAFATARKRIALRAMLTAIFSPCFRSIPLLIAMLRSRLAGLMSAARRRLRHHGAIVAGAFGADRSLWRAAARRRRDRADRRIDGAGAAIKAAAYPGPCPSRPRPDHFEPSPSAIHPAESPRSTRAFGRGRRDARSSRASGPANPPSSSSPSASTIPIKRHPPRGVELREADPAPAAHRGGAGSGSSSPPTRATICAMAAGSGRRRIVDGAEAANRRVPARLRRASTPSRRRRRGLSAGSASASPRPRLAPRFALAAARQAHRRSMPNRERRFRARSSGWSRGGRRSSSPPPRHRPRPDRILVMDHGRIVGKERTTR